MLLGYVVLAFIVFSICYQCKILSSILEKSEETKDLTKDLWKILAIMTTSFTVIFSTTIIGVFKTQMPKNAISYLNNPTDL